MVVWEALDALSHQFELCGIDAETVVVLLTPPEPNHEAVDLVRAAVARTGAEAVDVRPVRVDHHEPARLLDGPLLGPLLKQADVLIDCLPMVDLAGYVPAGIGDLRVLRLGAAAARPHGFPPHASMRRRVEAFVDLARSAASLTISDRLGTSLSVQLAGASVTADHGFVTDPGSHGSFPAGWVEVAPAAASVEGDLVIMPGDGNVAAGSLVSSPVRVCVRNDHITAIEGDGPDADVIRALLELSESANAYAIASVAVGMNPGSTPAGQPFDPTLLNKSTARLTSGVVTVTFGENLVAARPCDAQMPITLSRRDLVVGDIPVISAGRLQGQFAPDVYESPA